MIPQRQRTSGDSRGKERKEGRKKEEEKCGDGREERGRVGERAWDSMVDSTNVQ